MRCLANIVALSVGVKEFHHGMRHAITQIKLEVVGALNRGTWSRWVRFNGRKPLSLVPRQTSRGRLSKRRDLEAIAVTIQGGASGTSPTNGRQPQQPRAQTHARCDHPSQTNAQGWKGHGCEAPCLSRSANRTTRHSQQ
eukprot:10868062-Lingulodinium_polyedra.AAC.1